MHAASACMLPLVWPPAPVTLERSGATLATRPGDPPVAFPIIVTRKPPSGSAANASGMALCITWAGGEGGVEVWTRGALCTAVLHAPAHGQQPAEPGMACTPQAAPAVQQGEAGKCAQQWS